MKTKWVLLTIVIADIVAMIVFFACFNSCRTNPKKPALGQACAGCDMKTCHEHIATLDLAVTSLDAARKSLDAGDARAATVEVDKAAAAIKGLRDSMNANMMKMMPATEPAGEKVVNTRCPMMSGDVDPNNTPHELIRVYKGRKIGFCCGGCPAQWDKLTDAEKDKKLAGILTSAGASKDGASDK